MSAEWYVEGALEDCVEVVTCPECPSTLGVADARAWRLEHNADGSHYAVSVEVPEADRYPNHLNGDRDA